MRIVRCHSAVCTTFLFFLSLLPSLILSFTVTPRLPSIVFQKTTSSSNLLQLSSNYQQRQKKDRQPWLPPQRTYDDDDIFAIDHEREHLEECSISYVVNSINLYLSSSSSSSSAMPVSESTSRIAHGKFLDLTITKEGELVLEHLISTGVVDRYDDSSLFDDDDVIRGAIVALQSLLILGMQIGVKGSPVQQRRMVSHLSPDNRTPSPTEQRKSNRPRPRFSQSQSQRRQAPAVVPLSLKERFQNWNFESISRLKHDRDVTAGIQILSSLKMKQSAMGAFDLLVRLGVWGRHEDVVFLRSGFPVRFTTEEEEAAREAEESPHDPDTLLGIRRDLRHLNTYTIDGASTSEIDDGLSVETLTETNSDGSTSSIIRYWIHIADADRWCSQRSQIIKAARRRMTSLYLPTGTIPMFPNRIGVDRMSLTTSRPSIPALSLGVCLHPDGSIDESSLILTSSLVTVSYRLTYADVDEMLMEGVAYNEEWPLGVLLKASQTRRQFRMTKGSMEAMIPTPIPRGTVRVDGTGDCVKISVSVDEEEEMASPANLLVTEMMILAGEAMGTFGIISQKKKTKNNINTEDGFDEIDNELQLPYRSQKKPDFESNETGYMTLQNLQKTNAGNGYCAAWYFRRFFSPVKVSLTPRPHHGMGLDCYVQWTSPIRRYSDLQVHAAVKRYLRRERINEFLRNGEPIPSFISDVDLGCPLPNAKQQTQSLLKDNDISTLSFEEYVIDYDEGRGMFLAARPLQRQSETYWLFEYIRRATLMDNNDEYGGGGGVSSLECTVLGCVDSSRHQYCVYVHEWGLEHRYLSEMGQLTLGQVIFLKVASVNPRMGLLTLTLAPPPGKRVKH